MQMALIFRVFLAFAFVGPVVEIASARSEYRTRLPIFDSANPLSDYADVLSRRKQQSLHNLPSWKNADAAGAARCEAAYESLLSDGVIKISFVFGYHDVSSSTYDGGLYQYTLDALTRPCSLSTEGICGFRATSSRGSYAAKLVRTVDISGRKARIQITLAHSSVSSTDAFNMEGGEASRAQKTNTRYAEDLFFGGISGVKADGSQQEKCEICIYYGHARDGGGPDFGPVPHAWRTAEGKPNYDIYQSRRPGYRRLVASLLAAQAAPPKLVSLLACYTHKHFWARKTCVKNEPGCAAYNLADFSGKTGFVLSRELSWPENFGMTTGVMLDTILGFKCRSAWQANMSRLKSLPGDIEDYGMFGSFF